MSKPKYETRSEEWAAMVKTMQASFNHLLNDHDFKNHAFQGMIHARTPILETLDILLKSNHITDAEKSKYYLQAWRDTVAKMAGMGQEKMNEMSNDEFVRETFAITIGAMALFQGGTIQVPDGRTLNMQSSETATGGMWQTVEAAGPERSSDGDKGADFGADFEKNIKRKSSK